MSLTHGHYFIAEQTRAKLSAALDGVIERNTNAYLLGSVGPDVLYWADYGKWPFGEYELVLGCDPHVAGSGDMITALVREYIQKRRASKTAEERLLAFILGWITHWAADLYIHTLVDKYGGIYGSATPRHIQLELVETKYIQTIKPEFNNVVLESDSEISLFLADAVARAYPEARIKPFMPGHLGPAAEPPKKVSDHKLEFLRFAHTGYYMIALGWDGANRGSQGATSITSVGGAPAKTAWAMKGANLPSQAVYEGLLDPIQVQAVTPSMTSVEADIRILDTGLYGKFLVDYKAFADRAGFRAASIIELIEAVVTGLFPGPEPSTPVLRPDPPDWESPVMPILNAAIRAQGSNINILIPEEQLGCIDKEIMAVFEDKTIRAQFDRQGLFYQLEYRVTNQEEPTRISGTVPIELTGTNGLLGSHAGAVRLNIPIENPDQLPYEYNLRVSLTDEEVFGKEVYEKVEYKECGKGFFDGDLMAQLKRCNQIEVFYTGPLRLGNSREGEPMTFSDSNTAVTRPFPMGRTQTPRTVRVDLRENGRNQQDVAISWTGNSFKATLTANETYMELLMPGEERKPKVAGGSKKSVSIEGILDPVAKTISVSALDTFDSSNLVSLDEDPNNKESSTSSTTFAATALPFQGMTEEGDLVEFGVDTLADLQRCQVDYRAAKAAKGRFLGSTGEHTEEMLFKEDAEEGGVFGVRFSIKS